MRQSASTQPPVSWKPSSLWFCLTSSSLIMVMALGCENADDRSIAEAQKCLDTATAGAGANRCLELVGSQSGAEASSIRCSAKYLQRGVTESSFVEAYKSLSVTPAANTSQVLNLVSYITFTGSNSQTGAAPLTDANFVFDECAKANSKGMLLLAAATKMGTETFALFGGAIPSDPSVLGPTLAAQIQDPSFTGSATELQIGTAAISAYGAYCAGGTKKDSICTTLTSAIATGGSNAQAVGAALGALLAPTPTP